MLKDDNTLANNVQQVSLRTPLMYAAAKGILR